MTRILVTGATGFIGSHILEAVAAEPGLTPIAACRQPERLLPGLAEEVRMGDLRDAQYRADLVKGVDVLCHAAAWTSAWGHASLSDEHFLAPSLALIDQAVSAGAKRVIFLSSTSVTAPKDSADPMSIARPEHLGVWPHLRNVARIENHMRALAQSGRTEMVTLRTGLFAGRRYSIGLLPLLLPRLRTHLVPWVAGGRSKLPIVAGEDIGQAFMRAAIAPRLTGYQAFNIVGPQMPSARQVIEHICNAYDISPPHFSVPFPVAYAFARAMELLDPVVPWEPLVTRSIIHLLEETNASNDRAQEMLGYTPRIGWREALDMQMQEMARRKGTLSMTRPLAG